VTEHPKDAEKEKPPAEGAEPSRRTTPRGVPEIPREAYPESGKKSGVPTSAPPETSQMPESMRANLLSMANARVPSERGRAWEELVLDPLSEEPPTRPSQVTAPPAEDTSPSGSLFGRRIRGSSASPPPEVWEESAELQEDEPVTREHAIVEERVPTSSMRPGDMPREEPENEENRPLPDSGDRTIFSPARAAAALTSAAAVAAAATGGARTPSVLPPPAKIASGAPPSCEDTVREMRDR
jgi:hypothetical protein